MMRNQTKMLAIIFCFLLAACAESGVLQDVIVRNTIASPVQPPVTVSVSGASPDPLINLESVQKEPENLLPTLSQSPESGQSVPEYTENKNKGPAVQIELQQLKVKEMRGNGDNKINKGELIYILPVLINTGYAPSNRLKLRLTSTDSDLDIRDRERSASVIHPHEVAETQFSFIVDPDTPPKNAPVFITVTDDFGNEWVLEDTVSIEEIDNHLIIEQVSTKVQDTSKSYYGWTHDSLIFDFAVTNTGKSDTNPFSITAETNSKNMSSGFTSYLGSIAANSSKKHREIRLDFLDAVPDFAYQIKLNDPHGNEWEAEIIFQLTWEEQVVNHYKTRWIITDIKTSQSIKKTK